MVWKVAQHFCGENLKNMMVFATADNYLEVLGEYVDLENLPPCLYEGGKGRGGVAMPNSLDGGKVPSWEELDRMWETRQQQQEKNSRKALPKQINAKTWLSVQTSTLTGEDNGPMSQRSGATSTAASSPSASSPSSLSFHWFAKAARHTEPPAVKRVEAKVARLGGGFFELSDDDDATAVLTVCG